MLVSIDGFVYPKMRRVDKFQSDFLVFMRGEESKRRSDELLTVADKHIRKMFRDSHKIGLLQGKVNENPIDGDELFLFDLKQLKKLVIEYEKYIETFHKVSVLYFHESEVKIDWCDYPAAEFYSELRAVRMSEFLENVQFMEKKLMSAEQSIAVFNEAEQRRLEEGSIFPPGFHDKIESMFLEEMNLSRNAHNCADVIFRHIIQREEHLIPEDVNNLKVHWVDYLVDSTINENEAIRCVPMITDRHVIERALKVSFSDFRSVALAQRSIAFEDLGLLSQSFYHEDTTSFLQTGSQISRLGKLPWFTTYLDSVKLRLRYIADCHKEILIFQNQLVLERLERSLMSSSREHLVVLFIDHLKQVDVEISAMWKVINMLFVLGPHQWKERRDDGSYLFWWRIQMNQNMSRYHASMDQAHGVHFSLTIDND
jgi:hypothetical protein